MGSPSFSGKLTGHGGNHAVEVARHHGVDTLFTLSGGHIFPIYDGAVKADPPMRLLDVRHEQTAVFAAEAVGKLTRRAGWAALTAGHSASVTENQSVSRLRPLVIMWLRNLPS